MKVSLDAAGNAFVSGFTVNATTFGGDFKTLKYAAADGAVLWEKSSSGSGEGVSAIYSSKVDAAGNLIVVGTVRHPGNEDMRTIKYRGSDGVLMWQNDYAGTGSSRDQGYAVAVDPNGHAAVAGFSEAAGSGFKVILYWSTGVKAWENAPITLLTPRDTYGTFVRVDGAGNVFAAGSYEGPFNNGDNEEVMLSKFSGADGAQQWAAFYNGPSRDFTRGLAMDAAGNLVIASESYSPASVDMRTIKFSGASGQPLWTSVYDNPSHTTDIPYEIATDPSGHVYVGGRADYNKIFRSAS